ncbi:HTH-type transcriptional regulator ArgP [Massilia oculi]|uniref:HTH-type transcriptional regulator ArgP n=1 Tax=Massilia hydrophila TaxID=3044279 RepID=A0ABS7Y9K4_9BURK|nr:HTH-type transcriptional regulator ArgP [Massilia oculi]MCA1856375.1 HTH-type transcriptional regulator ArgP [Massilia oculi]
MDLDSKQAEAFLAVAETGSFERAGARLNITPSAVSQRLRVLESSLGKPMIVRSRPCRPTPMGQRLLQYLRRAQLLKTDFEADIRNGEAGATTVSMALNSDSLGTWFFPALAGLLARDQFILDLVVEDQDHTFALLKTGMVIGCVSTVAEPMRGCSVEALGTMRYRLVASRAFCQRWLPDGLTREAARRAPVVAYTRKDTLGSNLLLEHFGLPEGAYPCHYVPGTEAHFQAVRYGIGYAMVPQWLLDKHDDRADPLVDLARAHPTDVALYWHTWKLQSPRMDELSRHIVTAARAMLDG